jgi:hypothetical protein
MAVIVGGPYAVLLVQEQGLAIDGTDAANVSPRPRFEVVLTSA